MQGTVTFYGPDIESGKIKTRAGEYYSFRKSDWSSSCHQPESGMAVVFETRQASSVFKRALRIEPANDRTCLT